MLKFSVRSDLPRQRQAAKLYSELKRPFFRCQRWIRLEVLQPVQTVQISFGACNKDIRISPFAKSHETVFLQPDRHLALSIRPAADGIDREANESRSWVRHLGNGGEGGINRTDNK